MKKTLLVFALSSSLLEAEEKHSKKAWLASAIALVASAGFDSYSSQGLIEDNPLIAHHNQFTFSSGGVKFGLVGASILVQGITLHKHPNLSTRKLALENYAFSGMLIGAGVHNEFQKH